MIVQPAIVHHPKFIALRADVGDRAMEYLVRIWGHCQVNKRGSMWVGATPQYVEIVAAGETQRGKLFDALKAIGWLHQTPEGIRIHDWDEHNSVLLGRWNRNGSHKPAQPPAQVAAQPPAQTPTQTCVQVAAQPPAQTPTRARASRALNSSQVYSNPIPSDSESVLERERAGGAIEIPNGETKRAIDGQLEASKLRAGILISQIRDLEAEKQPSREQLEMLGKKKRELKALQERQASGDFSV
jgi:hypothetical protein